MTARPNLGIQGNNPDSKVHGANMGTTWVLSAPDGTHVGPMILAIRESFGRLWITYRDSCFIVVKLSPGHQLLAVIDSKSCICGGAVLAWLLMHCDPYQKKNTIALKEINKQVEIQSYGYDHKGAVWLFVNYLTNWTRTMTTSMSSSWSEI